MADSFAQLVKQQRPNRERPNQERPIPARLLFCVSIFLMLLVSAGSAASQTADSTAKLTAPQARTPYSLSVAVDEGVLTFHAADAHGLPIRDLKLDELRLLDNGKPPLRVLAFASLEDVPIRAGILMDMSASMDDARSTQRAIAIRYTQQLLRQQTDQAFVINFDRRPRVSQSWTNNTFALIDGIRNRDVKTNGEGRIGGTAIFDAIYHACHDQFAAIDRSASGHFILLFSDGEDNASDMSLKDAVNMCQSANTAIYAFRAESEPRLSATGPRTLAELTSQTGGRVFRADDTDAAVVEALRTIEADLRNQYRLVYKPAELNRDGSFHRIELQGAQRVAQITVRSGYYAPAR
jgi:VWFA-related protein